MLTIVKAAIYPAERRCQSIVMYSPITTLLVAFFITSPVDALLAALIAASSLTYPVYYLIS